MSEWISCTDQLPPKGMLVEVSKAAGGSALINWIGESQPYQWVFKSGLNWYYVDSSDKWRKINPIIFVEPGK